MMMPQLFLPFVVGDFNTEVTVAWDDDEFGFWSDWTFKLPGGGGGPPTADAPLGIT